MIACGPSDELRPHMGDHALKERHIEQDCPNRDRKCDERDCEPRLPNPPMLCTARRIPACLDNTMNAPRHQKHCGRENSVRLQKRKSNAACKEQCRRHDARWQRPLGFGRLHERPRHRWENAEGSAIRIERSPEQNHPWERGERNRRDGAACKRDRLVRKHLSHQDIQTSQGIPVLRTAHSLHSPPV